MESRGKTWGNGGFVSVVQSSNTIGIESGPFYISKWTPTASSESYKKADSLSTACPALVKTPTIPLKTLGPKSSAQSIVLEAWTTTVSACTLSSKMKTAAYSIVTPLPTEFTSYLTMKVTAATGIPTLEFKTFTATNAATWFGKTYTVGFQVAWDNTRVTHSWNAVQIKITDAACETGYTRATATAAPDPVTTTNTFNKRATSQNIKAWLVHTKTHCVPTWTLTYSDTNLKTYGVITTSMPTTLSYVSMVYGNANQLALCKDGGRYTITATPTTPEGKTIEWTVTSVKHTSFTWTVIVGDDRCVASKIKTVTKPATYIDTVYKSGAAKKDITVAVFTTDPSYCAVQLRQHLTASNAAYFTITSPSKIGDKITIKVQNSL